MVPRPVAWPQAWVLIVQEIRRDARPKVWEILSGTLGLTQAFDEAVWPVAPPIDVALGPSIHLLSPLFMAGIIDEGRVLLLHLGPPCSSFSIALNSARASAVLSVAEPAGLHDNPEYKEDKVRLGNSLADATVVLASAQAPMGRCTQFEQPQRPLMLDYPPVETKMEEFKFVAYQRDACVDGAP